MGRKTTKDSESSFTRMLAWTVLLALVFSAGLITGQRLLRADAKRPMVSLSTTKFAKQKTATGEAAEPALRTTFSFYEHLTASKEAVAQPKPRPAPPDQQPQQREQPAKEEAEPAEETAEREPEPAEQPEVADEKAADEEPEPVDEPPAEQPEPDAAPEQPADSEEVAEPARVVEEVVDALRRDNGGGSEPKALPARYTLQVSSHPDRSSAERELARLRRTGLEPHAISVDVPGKGELWRIRVGKFHTMDEARKFQGSLKSKRGVAGFVTPL